MGKTDFSISVVIPTYNRSKTIKSCLDSVLSQTYSPLEIIVVDDCSTDETVAIAQSYSDPRIRCIVLEKNSGAQAARNRGILEAKGDWIAFQDSDDEWLPEKLENQISVLNEYEFDPWTVIYTNAVWFDVLKQRNLDISIPKIEGKDAYKDLLKNPGPMFQGMLVSKQALQKINYLDEKVPSYQEWDTSIRLSQYCRFVYIKEPLFIYKIHEGETISKGKMRDVKGYQYILNKFENDIKKICGPVVWENHMFIQLSKCLNYRLWGEADFYLEQIDNKYSCKYWIFKMCRLFHIQPSLFQKIYQKIKRVSHTLETKYYNLKKPRNR